MSERDDALYHLHEWWLAGNDETLHHAGVKLFGVMLNRGWIVQGTRMVVTDWGSGLETCQDVPVVKVHRLTDLGRRDLLDWMRAKWHTDRGMTP